jgi:hypothetical protein
MIEKRPGSPLKIFWARSCVSIGMRVRRKAVRKPKG